MAVLKFEDLEFIEEKECVKVLFLTIYYFILSKDELSRIASFKVYRNSIEFSCSEKKSFNKFNQLLVKGFARLKCLIGDNPVVYAHKNSGIPLIGSGVFGLIDRGTNCVEVKPLTACNLDCVFCSVDSGISSKRSTGYIIEKDYLLAEFNKLTIIKKGLVEAHIGPQGEPLLYKPLVELVKGLKNNKKVGLVSIDTNGTLLTEKLIDELAEAGLDRINVSLQSLDEKKCCFLANKHYNLNHVLKMINYANKKMSVLLAPVIVPGLNDDDLPKLVNLSKSLKPGFPVIGVQNFLNYKRGRNPVKQRSWEEFFSILEEQEKKSGVKLKLSKNDFNITPDASLNKPFKKRETIKGLVVCKGPLPKEKIISFKERAVIVEKAEKLRIGSEAKALIIRDKHNIFRGIAI